jgi:hypothetical protein
MLARAKDLDAWNAGIPNPVQQRRGQSMIYKKVR